MKRITFFPGLLLAIASIFFLNSCSKSDTNNNSGGGGGGGNANTIYMNNMAYSNTNLQISAGVRVTWVNNDNMTHTVTADDNSFDSGDIGPGGTFNYTFNTAGTYAYHCKYHSTMKGAIVVIMTGGKN